MSADIPRTASSTGPSPSDFRQLQIQNYQEREDSYPRTASSTGLSPSEFRHLQIREYQEREDSSPRTASSTGLSPSEFRRLQIREYQERGDSSPRTASSTGLSPSEFRRLQIREYQEREDNNHQSDKNAKNKEIATRNGKISSREMEGSGTDSDNEMEYREPEYQPIRNPRHAEFVRVNWQEVQAASQQIETYRKAQAEEWMRRKVKHGNTNQYYVEMKKAAKEKKRGWFK
jgi:hypothetical protein